MPPDLNSLPPSPSPSTPAAQQSRSSSSNMPAPSNEATRTSPSNSPSAHSLAAAAALNAGIQSEERRPSAGSLRSNTRIERRRSSVRMSLSLNDPGVPGPGEMATSSAYRSHGGNIPTSPSRQRAPSLGELHQELENEQEAQVNRLLHMIRQQQAQIQTLQSNQASTNAIEDSAPPSEASLSQTPSHSNMTTIVIPTPANNNTSNHPSGRSRSPHQNLSRHPSYRSSGLESHDTSPLIHPISSSQFVDEFGTLGTSARDENVFYQAETQMLTRENQMLKLRIRELERQLNEMNSNSPITHSPTTASNLHSSSMSSVDGDATAPSAARTSETPGNR